MVDRRQAVERALAYPYATPERSFAQLGERTVALREVEVDLAGRTPLIAYGSNAAPEALGRKLRGDRDPLPMLRATLRGFDVVYSAHLSAYGSVPATLRRSPGTAVTVFVGFPTAAQLGALSETEPNYELERLERLSCQLEGGGEIEAAAAYMSRHGHLLLDGSEVALEAIDAERRRLPSLGQREALEGVRDLVRPGWDLERFVLERAAGGLRDAALPAAHPA